MNKEQFRQYGKSLGLWKEARLKAAKPCVICLYSSEEKEPQKAESISKSKAPLSTAQRLDAQRQANLKANEEVVRLSPNNAYWPPYNPMAPEEEKNIDVEFTGQAISVAALSLEEARDYYKSLGGKDVVDGTKDHLGLVKGGADAYSIAKGLGGLGVKSYTKNIHGKDWVIIYDFRRHQQTLMKSNKWGANNPRVIKAGLGLNDLKGAMRYVKFNVTIEIAFAVGINVADYILRDDATLAELGVNTSADLAKGFISLVGAAAITATLPATVGVLATGAVFTIASFGINEALGYFDDEYEHSKTLTKSVEEYFQ